MGRDRREKIQDDRMLTRWWRVDALEGVLCKRWRQGGVAIVVLEASG